MTWCACAYGRGSARLVTLHSLALLNSKYSASFHGEPCRTRAQYSMIGSVPPWALSFPPKSNPRALAPRKGQSCCAHHKNCRCSLSFLRRRPDEKKKESGKKKKKREDSDNIGAIDEDLDSDEDEDEEEDYKVFCFQKSSWKVCCVLSPLQPAPLPTGNDTL